MFASHDGLCSIGELAEHAGVTVKTVRFYSDEGLLPEARRSTGGHRRYGPDALERLHLIRALRALDLPVRDVRRVLQQHDVDTAGGPGSVLEDAVAGRLSALGTQLTALRWQEAGLHLVQDSPPAELADRLRLLGAISTPPTTDSLVRFWRGWLPPRMPPRSTAAFLAVAVPQPPPDPAPAQALAFARLHALVSRPCPGAAQPQPAAHRATGADGAVLLYEGLAEAYELAGAQMLQGRAPHRGEALDSFVQAYVNAYGGRDTPHFRTDLRGQLATDPRIDRYWDLVSETLTPPGACPAPTPGSAHDWLCAALDGDDAGITSPGAAAPSSSVHAARRAPRPSEQPRTAPAGR
ncbi:MerR family transcriptional regulator [Streptomyces sp. NPDC058657]|uniref:helix-turn-helix domain-containing protein n=1 Tax=unclassified Streptomyces TaxID=2593676 RepID=UPI003654D761